MCFISSLWKFQDNDENRDVWALASLLLFKGSGKCLITTTFSPPSFSSEIKMRSEALGRTVNGFNVFRN